MAEGLAYLPATRLVELSRTKQLSPVAVIGETVALLERHEGPADAAVKAKIRPLLALS